MARGMTDIASRLMPEWHRHAALWMGWPHLAEEWSGDLEGPRREITAFIRALAPHVTIKLAAGSDEAIASASDAVGDVATVTAIPSGDIWLRDTGPIVTGTGAARKAHVFRFNGWGGKFLMPGDDQTAQAIALAEGLPVDTHDFVLEGGAIDVDGEGRLLTTRECLGNANRNPDLSDADMERQLCEAFGAREIVWLEEGLLNDHTDGHVDNIARFVAPGRVLCQHPSGPDDPHAERLKAIEDALSRAGLEVATLPSPGRIVDADGGVLPASHMNFTITNGIVAVPVYEDHFSHVALAELRSLFPDRKVIGLEAGHILRGGGSFHCMTREIPV